jgi:hypothetical protein
MEYNDKLHPEEQIDAEEQIASILFDDVDIEISEEVAQDTARRILSVILERFRPDLMEAQPTCQH